MAKSNKRINSGGGPSQRHIRQERKWDQQRSQVRRSRHGKPTSGVPQRRQSAYVRLRHLFSSYGLPSSPDVLKVIKAGAIGGYSADEIQMNLEQTAAWKQRFKGNELLRKRGQPVLSVAEYLSVERAYSQAMKAAGLPHGFWNKPDDFAKLIGASVSPDELQKRIHISEDIGIGGGSGLGSNGNRHDRAITRELERRGITRGDVTAYVLDPRRSLPQLQKKFNSVLIGAAARRAGATTSVREANHLADIGITEDQAIQGFGQVAEFNEMQDLGSIYGLQYDQSDAEAEVFENDAEAAKRRERIANQETSQFSGSSSLGTVQQDSAGQF